MNELPDPHRDPPVVRQGIPLEAARAAAVLVHGRGATAESILTLATELALDGFTYLAPQARNGTWYPLSFLAPIEQNEPNLTAALGAVARVVDEVIENGIPPERIALLGFSQGACLTLEFAVRNPRRYGAIVAFTGGVIGPRETPRDYPGSFDGAPVFLGSSDPDPHVPVWRFHETKGLLESMGAEVTARLYPGMPHTVNRDELDHARRLLTPLAGPDPGAR